jgi:hypothetical protein
VPDKGEQMVRYYGYCSNMSRGKPQKAILSGVASRLRLYALPGYGGAEVGRGKFHGAA